MATRNRKRARATATWCQGKVGSKQKENRTGTEKHAAYPKPESGSRGEIGGKNHGETHYGRKWNQLYFGSGWSVLSRPVSPVGDGVSDWKIWNVAEDVFKGASERGVSGAGTSRETECAFAPD